MTDVEFLKEKNNILEQYPYKGISYIEKQYQVLVIRFDPKLNLDIRISHNRYFILSVKMVEKDMYSKLVMQRLHAVEEIIR